MTSQTQKAKAKLATLSASFDDLEAQLAPLFSQTLPEAIVGLEPIQQAKLQTVIPYLVYDLVFIYLKSRGIDPKTHPVVPELDRVRQYFEKISIAEKGSPAKRAEIDKAAAGRFIKHAITQATYGKTPSDTLESTPALPPTSSFVELKVTSKMLERQQYEKDLLERDAEESEEDVLEGFEDGDMSMDADAAVSSSASKGKGKSKEVPPDVEVLASKPNKRRRSTIDPFAGYGDEVFPGSTNDEPVPRSSGNPVETTLPSTTETPAPSVFTTKSKSRRGKKRGLEDADSGSPPDLPGLDATSNQADCHQDSPGPEQTRKARKTRRKARKSLTTPT